VERFKFLINAELWLCFILLGIVFFINAFSEGFWPLSFTLWMLPFDEDISSFSYWLKSYGLGELFTAIVLMFNVLIAYSFSSWFLKKIKISNDDSYLNFIRIYFFILLETLPLFFLFALIIQIYGFSKLKLISISLGIVSFVLIIIFLIFTNKRLLHTNNHLSDKKKLGWYWWLFCFFSTHFCFPWVIGLIIIFAPSDHILGIPILKIIILSISILLISSGIYLRIKKLL